MQGIHFGHDTGLIFSIAPLVCSLLMIQALKQSFDATFTSVCSTGTFIKATLFYFLFRKFLQLQKSILWEVNHMAHAVSIFSGSWHQRLEVWECSLNKNQIYSADKKCAHIQQRGARENNHTKPRLRNIRYLLIVFVIFFRFISSWQRRLSWKHVRFSFILLESLLVSRFARESHFAWVSRFARVSCYARMTRFARCVLWLTFCD